MSQRLTRKEIKRDQFRETMVQALDFAGSHVRNIVVLVGAVVVLTLGGVGVYTWLQARSAHADEAFNEAVRTYQALIDKEDPAPDDPRAPRFASEKARRAAAKERFLKVEESYSGTDAAHVASLYLGKIALEEGDTEAARRYWQFFVDKGGDSILVAEAYLNLIALDRQEGRAEEVAARLEAMLDTPDPKIPTDALLFELATTYEKLGRDQEALDTYRRLVEEFGSSGYLQEAQQRLAALGGGPGGLGSARAGLPAGLTG
jgi:tetratricopeptide (TPR) repeat protein